MKKVLLGGVCAALCLTLTGCGEGKMKLKKDEFKLEFGKAYSTKPSTYVEADKEVLKDAKVEIDGKKYYEGEYGEDFYKRRNVLKPGTYTGRVIYGDEKDEFKLKVVDTKAPVCYDKDIVVTTGYTQKDIENKIKDEACFNKFAGDGIEGGKTLKSVKLKSGELKAGKPGEYEAKYVAYDDAKNKSKEFTANVRIDKAIKEATMIGKTSKGITPKFKFKLDKKGNVQSVDIIIEAKKGSNAYSLSRSDFVKGSSSIASEMAEELHLEGGNKSYKKTSKKAIFTLESKFNDAYKMTYEKFVKEMESASGELEIEKTYY